MINDDLLLVFKPYNWMGGKDSHFLGHLKTSWDLYFSNNPKIIIALCGFREISRLI